jgi:multisubunit Na+/H+ antiporter MnhB subunit
MQKIIKISLSLILGLLSFAAEAQQAEMADRLRADGKIYVIVGIILIVLTGFILYLVLLDRKVKKLENILSGKRPQTK